MKSVKIAVVFGALSLVFMGCPYESKVPVDSQVNAKGDETMKGKWNEKSDDSYHYKITLEGNIYTIVKKVIKGDDAPTTYNGFFSDVEGTTFANVKINEQPFVADDQVPFGEGMSIAASDGIIVPIWTRTDNGKSSVWTAIIKHDELEKVKY